LGAAHQGDPDLSLIWGRKAAALRSRMAGLSQGKLMKESVMVFVAVIAVLLIAWLVIAVLGALLKGLFWLAIIGGILFVATAIYGAIKNKSRT
jgi:hypothetical protein